MKIKETLKQKVDNRKMDYAWAILTLQVGLIIILFGAVMNLGVVTKNGCRMPVKADFELTTQQLVTHFDYSDNSEVNFWYLTDIFNFKTSRWSSWWSIGDFVIIFGFLYSLYGTAITLYYFIKWFSLKRKLK